MILFFFSLILLFNTLYFLNDSCLQKLGEGTVAQWVVALINLTYSEHMYVGLTVFFSIFTFTYDYHMTLAYRKKDMPSCQHTAASVSLLF